MWMYKTSLCSGTYRRSHRRNIKEWYHVEHYVLAFLHLFLLIFYWLGTGWWWGWRAGCWGLRGTTFLNNLIATLIFRAPVLIYMIYSDGAPTKLHWDNNIIPNMLTWEILLQHYNMQCHCTRSTDKSVFHRYFRPFLDYGRISAEQAVLRIPMFCDQCTHVMHVMVGSQSVFECLDNSYNTCVAVSWSK